MKHLVAIMLCTVSFSAWAEGPGWWEGIVVLADGNVLRGEVEPQEMFDMVLFRDDDGLKALPAHAVAEVRYYDSDSNINRRFVSIRKPGLRRESNLYEVVLEGQVKVLRKLKRLHSKDKSDLYDYHYFIARNDLIVNLRQFRSKVYPDLVRTNPDAFMGYQRRNNLSPNRPADAILLISYFNNTESDRMVRRDNTRDR